MFKRLLSSSISAVLRNPIDSGVQVCPPGEGQPAARPRSGLVDWFTSSVPARAVAQRGTGADIVAGGDAQLAGARDDFIEALTDIRTQQAGELLQRIRAARSLRELWFLRPEVFSLVAHHRDQAEANQRMLVLASHFPRQMTPSPSGRLRAGRA